MNYKRDSQLQSDTESNSKFKIWYVKSFSQILKFRMTSEGVSAELCLRHVSTQDWTQFFGQNWTMEI